MRTCFLFPLLALTACTALPTAEGTRWPGSPNHDERRPNLIILHQTSSSAIEPALRTLTDPVAKVSAHFLIGRDGSVIALVEESRRAWHAGESWWGGITDINSASIGIELDNNGDEPFAEPQVTALIGTLKALRERHRIPAANVIGHGDVAPRRKVDPSRHFPWSRLAAEGFGLWCPAPVNPAPAGFDATLGLQAIGYDISDLGAARRAFRRHFLAEDNDDEWRSVDRDLIACLAGKKIAVTPEQRP